MKKALRYTGFGLLVLLVAAQLYRSPRNVGGAEGPRSILVVHPVPADVQAILRRSCYDCHSNNTAYPWYGSVQPVAWWLGKHISEGKAELNFSVFGDYDAKRAVRKLQATADEVLDRHMPLRSYLWMHREAKLTDADVTRLTQWAEDLAGEIESTRAP